MPNPTEFTKRLAIQALASFADTCENVAGNHIQGTKRYVRALAERLADHNRFATAA